MNNGGGFEANPEGLMDKGTEVNGIFERYMIEKGNVDTAKNRVTEAWSGADSAGFVTAIEGYEDDFKQLGEVIAQLGKIIYNHGNRLAESRENLRSSAARL